MNYQFDPEDDLARMTAAVLDAIHDQRVRVDPHGPKFNARDIAQRVRDASLAHRMLAHAAKDIELRKSEIVILNELLAEAEKRAASRQAMLDAALAALDERDEKIPALQ